MFWCFQYNTKCCNLIEIYTNLFIYHIIAHLFVYMCVYIRGESFPCELNSNFWMNGLVLTLLKHASVIKVYFYPTCRSWTVRKLWICTKKNWQFKIDGPTFVCFGSVGRQKGNFTRSFFTQCLKGASTCIIVLLFFIV